MAFLIGIDPGDHTGVAVWNTVERELTAVRTMQLHQALKFVSEIIDDAEQTHTLVEVHFEDARQRRWLPMEKSASDYRGKLMGAGSVKRDCTIWEEFLTDQGVPFHAIPPRKGATKWAEDYFKRITGWKGRTSNHARDAAALVYGR